MKISGGQNGGSSLCPGQELVLHLHNLHGNKECKVGSSVPDPDPRVFFGRPDPDPLVRGMDPDPALDPDPSIIVQK